MSWWSQAAAMAAAVAVLFGPGLLAALLVRLRGFALLGVAPLLSAAMLTAASLLNVVAPFHWSAVAWGASVMVFLAAAWGIRRAGIRWGGAAKELGSLPESGSVLRSVTPFMVLAIVAAVSAMRLTTAIGRPDDISQTFDNLYHLNAARLVFDEGLIAPTRQMLPGFYPDLWHVIVATTAELSGAGIPVAVNAVSVMLGALVWPASCIWLVRVIAGRRLDATIAAGALSVGMASFPLLMMDFGVLYPNLVSLSLLPAAVGALLLVAGIGKGERPDLVVRWALLLAAVPAIALAHPSTLMAFLMVGFWISLGGYLAWVRRARSSGMVAARRRAVGWSLVLTLAVALALFLVARPSRELAYWPPSDTFANALRHLATGGLVWRPPSWPIVVAVVIGILTILVARRWRAQWWLIASLVTLCFIYIVCLSFPAGTFRYGISGTWYQDIFRIASLFPAVVVPLGAFAAVGVTHLCAALLRTRPRFGWLAPAGGALLGAVLFGFTQTGAALATEVSNTQAMYRQDASSPLLTDDERTLISRLSEHVPADDMIVGNPWTGTSLSYALAGRRALVPHIFQELTPDMTLIVTQLNRAAENAEVCGALERTSTRWVLDFGAEEIHNGDHSYPGLKGLGADVVQLVDQQGEASLYRIVACD